MYSYEINIVVILCIVLNGNISTPVRSFEWTLPRQTLFTVFLAGEFYSSMKNNSALRMKKRIFYAEKVAQNPCFEEMCYYRTLKRINLL
jgi:hypothetical protein